MKKYMVRCDMEGATGIVCMEQASPHGSEYEAGLRWFRSDLLAAVEGLNAAGADEIHIYDEHFYGRNVDLSALPDNAFAYCGKPPYAPGWAGGLDSSFAGMILVGLHAKAGTKNALLNHTYEDDILDMNINGVSVGEIGMEAAIAGELGVPMILVTADSEGIREAKALVPEVIGVCVKESLAPNGALCYPEKLTAARIREGARQAAVKAQDIPPYRVQGPVTLEVTLREGAFLNRMKENYPDVFLQDRVTIRAQSVLEAYSSYWSMKAVCLALQNGGNER